MSQNFKNSVKKIRKLLQNNKTGADQATEHH